MLNKYQIIKNRAKEVRLKKAKQPKKSEKKAEIVSNLVGYFAEDHGLHTFFTFVIIILLVIFGIVVYVFYSR